MTDEKAKLHPLIPAPGKNHNQRAWPVVPRRVRAKNASRACSECQKRKIKCIGTNPCRNCEENSLFCEINDETDGRRRTALKRKVEDLEQDREFLLRLVEALRDDDQHALQLFNLIRSNASLDDIRLAVENRLTDRFPRSSPSSSSLMSIDATGTAQAQTNNAQAWISNPYNIHSHQSMRRQIMDIDRLTEIPLFELAAQPWTETTTDNAFISHLISLWLSWDHVCRNWIDQDLFIKAMQSGDVNSPFCSPFLVNAILSQACLYSNYPEAFIDPDDVSSRGQHFYAEAKRRLDAMEGRVNLTTVQGVGMLYFSTCLMGKDRVGLHYMSQACHSIRELVSRSDEFIAAAGPEGDQMTRSIEITVRGLFSFLSLAGLSLQTPVIMKPPNRKHLPESHDRTDSWCPYPQRLPPQPAHRNCVHNQSFELHLIIYEVVDFFYSDKEQSRRHYADVEKAVHSFDARLADWFRNLPICISEGQSWTPGVLELHMRYYGYRATLHSLIKVHPSAPQAASSAAHQRCIGFVLAVRDLIHTHRAKWRRIEYLPLEYTQVIIVSLFTLLDDLATNTSREAFVYLAVLARAMARRFQLARGMLRLVQVTARQEKIALPEEVRPIFQDFEAEWHRTHDLDKFSSYYPNFVVSLRGTWRTSIGDSETEGYDKQGGAREKHRETHQEGSAELDLFLRKWDWLSIEDDGKVR
ncbi:hypothetical protein BGW36DRAFT_304596 [Talaromyces proteolyticus]|uniref:Zn(2)-C6 fungal-type domain-containing protein n=1 Tax=Talaromyces proteolyticus TaxID=1131652 RepID=A0AAD4KL24_9EURO|nr:uncharacterized protein BGW36DRAFT_304596 [Talaromyces proteolyticus]KAH8691636.1 hypothetical protein BGW36DRAFT_304596 [Talaromyces proteolyticus]